MTMPRLEAVLATGRELLPPSSGGRGGEGGLSRLAWSA